VELRAEWRLIRNEFPVAIDLACVFNSNSEFSHVVDEDITDVLFWKRELSLWAFTLSSHVQSESFFRASGVAERGAGVVVWTLRFESDAAGDLSVWPDLSLKWLDGENLILKEHWVIFDSLSDSLILSGKGGDSLFFSSFVLLLELVSII
jgi:hypothetical protein